jgi:hypothetical protein
MVNDQNPFEAPGRWYKGALHVHSTRSDGRLSPKAVEAAHREQGYHFLAMTDHDTITDLSAQSDDRFLNIPSVEVCYGRNAVGQHYHIVVLGVREMIDLPRETPVQEGIDRWTETSPVVFLAHPYWSGMTTDETMALERLVGLEIHNTSANCDLGKGLATVHWDDVLVRGKPWTGLAVDDTHWLRNNGSYCESFGGWVWVKAESLAEPAILEALARGSLYSSTGPEIDALAIEDGVAMVNCSAVAKVNFVGHSQWGGQVRAPYGETITQASYRLNGNERYLRVECVDQAGRTAWTNPVYL